MPLELIQNTVQPVVRNNYLCDRIFEAYERATGLPKRRPLLGPLVVGGLLDALIAAEIVMTLPVIEKITRTWERSPTEGLLYSGLWLVTLGNALGARYLANRNTRALIKEYTHKLRILGHEVPE